MSRIGKKCIVLSKKINTEIVHNTITIKGPKGKLSQKIHNLITVSIDNSNEYKILVVTAKDNTKQAQQLHGLSRTLIDNMIVGVSTGFSKRL
jgi:large subunit ribosomal protein L6